MSAQHDEPDTKSPVNLEAQHSGGHDSSFGSPHPVSNELKQVEDIFDIETDPKWQTTRKELWSYYLYYVGNNGLSGFNYGYVFYALFVCINLIVVLTPGGAGLHR